jgi:hypothetical protein
MRPAVASAYAVRMTVWNMTAAVTATTYPRRTWDFRSAAGEGGEGFEVLPLLWIDYDLAVDLRNRVARPGGAGRPAVIDLRIGHQAHAATAPVTGVTAQLSFYEGATWRALDLPDLGGACYRAEITALTEGEPLRRAARPGGRLHGQQASSRPSSGRSPGRKTRCSGPPARIGSRRRSRSRTRPSRLRTPTTRTPATSARDPPLPDTTGGSRRTPWCWPVRRTSPTR